MCNEKMQQNIMRSIYKCPDIGIEDQGFIPDFRHLSLSWLIGLIGLLIVELRPMVCMRDLGLRDGSAFCGSNFLSI